MGTAGYDARKKEQRRRFRAIRKQSGEERRAELDAAIEGRFLALPEYEDAEVLLAYLDLGPEVRTRGIIRAAWAAGKAVALPWCVPATREMRWFRVTSLDGLVRSPLGVEEPVPVDEAEQLLGTGQRMIALVPGLAFDARGYRMGYGGGFYDTFLAKFDGVSVGLCREPQMVGSLPELGVIDAHDRAVRIVVTDERIIRAHDS